MFKILYTEGDHNNKYEYIVSFKNLKNPGSFLKKRLTSLDQLLGKHLPIHSLFILLFKLNTFSKNFNKLL